MAVRKTRTGWIATVKKGTFYATERPNGARSKVHEVRAILVHGGLGQNTYLNYAGLDDSSWSTFELPSRPKALRALAKALVKHAADLESGSSRR